MEHRSWTTNEVLLAGAGFGLNCRVEVSKRRPICRKLRETRHCLDEI
jgi:hypothetical protein